MSMKYFNDPMGNRTCNVQNPAQCLGGVQVIMKFLTCLYIYDKIKYGDWNEELFCDVMSSVVKLPVFWRDLFPPSWSLKKETA
jgi:hypothetical protein